MSSGIDFVELDTDTAYDYQSTPAYLEGFYIVAMGDSGLGVYDITGTGNILLKAVGKNATCYAVTTDGEYIYSGEEGGVAAWSINNNNGELTLIDYNTTIGKADYLWYFENHDCILAGQGTNGLGIYTFDGSTVTVDSSDYQSGDYNGVRGYGDFVWVANESEGIMSYSYTGAGSLTYLNHNDPGGVYRDLEIFTFDDFEAGDRQLPFGSPPVFIVSPRIINSIKFFQDDGFGNISEYYSYPFIAKASYLSKFDSYLVLGNTTTVMSEIHKVTWNAVADDLTLTKLAEIGDGSNYNLHLIQSEDNSSIALCTACDGAEPDELLLYYVDEADTEPRGTFNLIGGEELVRLHMPDWGAENRSISKNIDVYDFWDGTLSTVDTGKNNEPLSISGYEKITGINEGICMDNFCMSCLCFSQRLSDRFELINTLMDNNYPVKIEGLGDCMDGIYVISSFEYSTVKGTPFILKWSMELEYKEDLS